jgi:hypothetical protein
MSTVLGLLAFAFLQDDGDAAFFEAKIRPVLAEHCIKCHGEKKHKGSLRLDTREGWQKGGDTGPALVPRKASSSLLIKMIRGEPGSVPQMPPDGPLPAAVVADFVTWIDHGAPDPRTGAARAVQAIDWKAAGDFWAFKPPASDPASKSIDQFVAEALAAKGLRPAARADRWTLIRRASFTLTGLPPSEDEVNAFLSDGSPDAFAKVVDRLLASPAYGEHQARRWLDLARYAEDQAHVTEGKLGHGWRYRDWVIESFAKNLPYDRFVRLQIAADLMEAPGDDPADRRALGFLGLGNIYARPNDIPRARAEQWDDRVDTLTRTFLGLTVSCARCHDHKYDPIPTLDYYSLTGIIAATKDTVLPIAPREQVAAYDAAAARAAAATEKAADFLRAETDRRALEKVETFEDPALAESVRKNLAKPLKQRNLDQIKALFGEKGKFPLTEKIVVDAAAEEWKREYAELQSAAKAAAAEVPTEPAKCHGVADVEKPADLKVFIRGNPHKLGEPAPRRFLRVLAGADAPRITRGSGRLELAEAIADPQNPLTARVLVNRIWQQHFGRGIVATSSNFGALGDRPTHPELLDALASRFARGGWSVKKLHREIVLSATWQRSSTGDPANDAVDPDNQWLWRGNRRRMTVEELRDSILAVSGGLDRAVGGSSGDLGDAAFTRRTVYARISRMELSPLLRLFDFPDPNLSSERRIETTLPQQSLFILNNPFMIGRARALAARASGSVPRMYGLVFGRAPSPAELALATAFLSTPDPSRFERLAHALLASNAFLFID